jgi:hypothetical protein
MTTPDDASENVKPVPEVKSVPEASAFSWKGFGIRLMQIGKTALTAAESIKALEKENERLQVSFKELTKEIINLRIAVAENKTRLDTKFENIYERIDLKLENTAIKSSNGSALTSWNGNARSMLSPPDAEPTVPLAEHKSRS